jgi:hypothetical protein
VFAAFAFAADVGAVAQGHVGAVEADEFGDTEPGLHGQQHQGPIPSAFPAVRVGGGDQRCDLGGGQEGHGAFVEPFRRDRQGTLDEQGVLGMAQRGEREQRPDRGQRTLRVRTLLCRSDSRWLRNAEIVVTSRSSQSSRVGAFPLRRCTKINSSFSVSR